jgi:acyl-CoA dehydrogenase
MLGGEQQKQDYFASFVQDTLCWGAYALSEPGVGSDAAGLQTCARRVGGGWVLNGTKWFIGNGARAHQVVVFATVNPSQGRVGVRCFLVRKGAPGFAVGQVLPSGGVRSLQIAELNFTECFIPDCDLLGPDRGTRGNTAFGAALQAFCVFRPTVAAMAIGVACAALDHARELCAQNGTLHGWARAWRSIQEKIEHVQQMIEVNRLLSWKAAWLLECGMDNSTLASIAKVRCAQTAMEACEIALRAAGNEGGFAGSALERMLRDARALDLLEGTGDMQRLNVARWLLQRRDKAVPRGGMSTNDLLGPSEEAAADGTGSPQLTYR